MTPRVAVVNDPNQVERFRNDFRPPRESTAGDRRWIGGGPPTWFRSLRSHRVAAAFEAVAVPWAIGGSFASTLYGDPRATNDIDITANLRVSHVTAFATALGTDFYADQV